MPDSLKSVLALLNETDIDEILDWIDDESEMNVGVEIREFLVDHFEIE